MGWGVGGQNVHLNQSYRKVDEMPKSTEQFFFIVWPIGGGRGGVRDQNVHLNQSYRKFDEMPKSTKILSFHYLANRGGGSKCSPEPMLQEI